MRTKALLLTAALAAAGVATSMAQVFSVNAVGYVNVTLVPGFNLVSVPLQATDHTIPALFRNITPSIPPGLKVFAFDEASGGFAPAVTWRGQPFNSFSASDPATLLLTVDVGEGAFVYSTATDNRTLTFVGEVRQGQLDNPLPAGFSIKANMVPQQGRPNDPAFANNNFPGTPGDKVFKFNKTTGGYDTWTYRGIPFNHWDNSNLGSTQLPVIDVGEAFFMYRATSAGTWSRTFSIN